eukprot:30173-Chlamydomonas_euryale.AAC.1
MQPRLPVGARGGMGGRRAAGCRRVRDHGAVAGRPASALPALLLGSGRFGPCAMTAPTAGAVRHAAPRS